MNEREDILFLVQKVGRELKWLTAGERICISQERGSLLRQYSDPTIEIRRVPPAVEAKIQHIWNIIKQGNNDRVNTAVINHY